MKTILKTTMAMAAATLLMTGCDIEDHIKDSKLDNDLGLSTGDSSTVGGDSSSEVDTFTLTKTANGFSINWTKNYSGYSEIIYSDGDDTTLRGDGYPFTSNAKGSYSMVCVESYSSDSDAYVSYRCERPDITYRSTVRMKKGVEYQWLVSYGTAHEHGETQAITQYVGGILSIQ